MLIGKKYYLPYENFEVNKDVAELASGELGIKLKGPGKIAAESIADNLGVRISSDPRSYCTNPVEHAAAPTPSNNPKQRLWHYEGLHVGHDRPGCPKSEPKHFVGLSGTVPVKSVGHLWKEVFQTLEELKHAIETPPCEAKHKI